MRWCASVVALIVGSACQFKQGVAGGIDGGGDGGGGDSADSAILVLDTDGDGIADGSDNCPTIANTDQYNEDGDDRGDACDMCPHMAGTVPGTDADDDGDGIGNQCDPRVGTDRRVLFLGFNTAADLALWQVYEGTNMWSISGGKLHQTDATLAMPQLIVWKGESIVGTVVADTTVHIDTVPAGTGTRLAAVVGGYYLGSTVDLYACGLRGADLNANATSTAWHFVNPPTIGLIASNPTAMTMISGIHAPVRLKVTDNNPNSQQDCTVATVATPQSVPGYVPEGYPGFRALNVVASFDYIFVVAVGP